MNYRTRAFVLGAAFMATCVTAQAQPAADAAAPAPAGKPMTMMASSLPCSNLERSIAFYTKGLGMVQNGRVEMGGATEVPLMFPGGGAYLILQNPRTPTGPLPARSALSRVTLNVPDLGSLVARLSAAGYELKGGIHEMQQYGVAIGMVEDPDGNHIELVQRTGQPAAAR